MASLESAAAERDAFQIQLYPYQRELMNHFIPRDNQVFVQEYLGVPYSEEHESIMAYVERGRRRELDVPQQIFYLRQDFIRRNGIMPNAVFLNQEDYRYLLRNSSEYFRISESEEMFTGLKIIRTVSEEPRVGLITLD